MEERQYDSKDLELELEELYERQYESDKKTGLLKSNADAVVDSSHVSEEKRYDVETLKFRLKNYCEIERDIDNQIERYERLEMKMKSIGSPAFDDMPKSPSPSHDRMLSMLIQKERLEKEIKASVKKRDDERDFIERLINNLHKADERAVIRMRYIDLASWNEVTDMMFGGKVDYIGKEDTYLRRTHKIHGAALLNMTIYLEKSDATTDTN